MSGRKSQASLGVAGPQARQAELQPPIAKRSTEVKTPTIVSLEAMEAGQAAPATADRSPQGGNGRLTRFFGWQGTHFIASLHVWPDLYSLTS